MSLLAVFHSAPRFSIFHPSTSAGPRPLAKTRRASTPYSDVSPCGQACLQTFVASAFPPTVCPDQLDLQCLCTKASTTGFTFGEGALRCVASDCLNAEESILASAYGVCTSIPNAQSMTHKTITASMAKSTTIQLNGQHVISASISSASTTTTTSTVAVASTTLSTSGYTTTSASAVNGIAFDTQAPPIPNNLYATAPASLPTTATSDSATSSSPILNTGQIAGIVAAGAVTVVVACGLLLYLFCWRKKKRKKKSAPKRHLSGSSFGGDEVVHERKKSSTPSITHFRFPVPPTGWSTSSTSISGRSQRGVLNSPVTPTTPRLPDFGSPLTPTMHSPTLRSPTLHSPTRQGTMSPASVDSYMTTSRLLPENPGSKPHPPLPTEPKPTFQSGHAPRSNYSSSLSHPIHLSSARNANFNPPSSRAGSSDRPWTPTVRTESNLSNAGFQSSNMMAKPQPAVKFSASHISDSRSNPRSKGPIDTMSSLHKVGAEAPSTWRTAPTPISKYAPLKLRQSNFRRPLTLHTTASDASFEDDIDISEASRSIRDLSPVVESPQRPPWASSNQVRYPAVPTKLSSPVELQGGDWRDASRTPHPFQLPQQRPSTPASQLETNDRLIRYELPALECQPRTAPAENRFSPLSPPDAGLAAKWQIAGGSPIQGLERVGPWGER